MAEVVVEDETAHTQRPCHLRRQQQRGNGRDLRAEVVRRQQHRESALLRGVRLRVPLRARCRRPRHHAEAERPLTTHRHTPTEHNPSHYPAASRPARRSLASIHPSLLLSFSPSPFLREPPLPPFLCGGSRSRVVVLVLVWWFSFSCGGSRSRHLC